MMTSSSRAWARAIGAAVLLAVVTGCFNPFSPRIAPERGTSTPPPVPNSPAQVVELFAWCWNNRAYQEYTEIFTDDFIFQLSAVDTAGQEGRGDFLTRTYELETALHLFVEGSATEPPARSITLELTRPLIERPDSRHAPANSIFKPEPWHKEIATDVTLRIDTGEQDFQVNGRARFFLVRGDSALIPPDLVGFRPDSARWWIERWVDETVGTTAATAPRIEARAREVRGPFTGRSLSRSDAGPREVQGRLDPMTLTWTRLKLAYLDRRPAANP